MKYLSKKIHIAEHTVVQEMGSGIVVLNLQSEHFYELKDVGKRFWELIAENAEYSAAINKLLTEYEVAEDQLNTDLTYLTEKLLQAELITVN